MPRGRRGRSCIASLVLLATLLVVGRAGGAPELNGEFALEVWTTEHGIPQNSITAVMQTREGYIWASTYNGIARFDGARFNVFDSANTKGLPNSRVTSFFQDERGEIWIGHDTGDLTCFSQGVFQGVALGGEWPRTASTHRSP